MESPSTGETTRIAARASIVDSFKGCGLSGVRIDKEELRRRLLMPQYLRFAVRDSIRCKDPTAGESHFRNRVEENVEPPEAPMVVFINPHSGGRHGPVLKERLQQLISEEQVPADFLFSLTEEILTKTSFASISIYQFLCICVNV